MTDESAEAPKPRGRPFQPGQSGNPDGRPKGRRNKTTEIVEGLLDGEAEELVRKAVELAKGGDGPMLRLCLDRIAPPRKDSPITFELPPIQTLADAKEASAAIIQAVATGEITPDEAERVIGLLVSHKAIIDATEFEQRLAALEEQRR